MSHRTVCAALAAAALLAASPIPGCARKHGKYTQAHLDKSNQRVSELKSMNEYQVARQAFLAGDLDKALLAVERSLTLNSEIAKSQVLRGRILIEKGEMNGARDSLLAAERIEAGNVEAQYYLGIVAERVNEFDEAQARYLNAARLDPTNAQYVVAAAEMMVDRGLLEEADEYLARQATAVENHPGVRQTRGHVAMLREDPETACTFFEEARLLAPDDGLIQENLVEAQIACGRFAEAEYNLACLLKTPGNESRRDIMHMRARCMLHLDRIMDARQIYIRLTEGDAGAKDVTAWIELGNVSYMMKDDRRLREAGARVTAIAPERFEGYVLKGLHHRRRGELEHALECFDRAAERRGTDTEPLVLRGLLLEQLGRADEARESYETALKQDPENTSIAQLFNAIPPKDTYATVPGDDR